jgi:thymidylate synthase ThyX
MRNVDIGIFCIAHTRVDRLAVQSWLDHIGADEYEVPSADQATDPALLVALAAKRCYMAFQKSLNPNLNRVRKDLTEYLDNVLKSGHGSVLEHATYTFAIEGISRVFCYHPDTEVLTRSGWKNVSRVEPGEVVLTKDPMTRAARWSKNKKTHCFDYTGELLHWNDREDHGPMVTPDHTLWASFYDLRKNRTLKASEISSQQAQKVKASDAWGRKFVVDHRINLDSTLDPVSIVIGGYAYDSALLFEWLGFVATDGTIVKPETGRSRIVINQTKKDRCVRIRELGVLLFEDRARESGERYKYFSVSDPDLHSWVISMVGRTNEERTLVSLFDYSPRLLTAFLAGACAGDGSHGSNGHIGICSGYSKLAADYQAIISMVGLASRIEERNEVGKVRKLKSGQEIRYTQPSYITHIHRRGSGVSIVKKSHQHKTAYTGKVYCPQTEDGVIFVRHPGGCAVWCGNTGEMNRHRAGVGISEGSMRYSRYTDIPWWMPTFMRLTDEDYIALEEGRKIFQLDFSATPEGAQHVYVHPAVLERLSEPTRSRWAMAIKKLKTQGLFARHFGVTEKHYAEGQDIWKEELAPDSKFHGKKQVTSMLRRLIPMGVATGGVWTMNLRAVRHILALRASEAAEEEIAHVFSRIAKFIVAREPMLLGDFKEIEGGFWVPAYKKV